MPNVPYIGQPIADWMDKINLPYAVPVFLIMIAFWIIVGFGSYALTKDLAWMGATTFIITGIFIALKLIVWFWFVPMAIVLAFCIVKRRVIQL